MWKSLRTCACCAGSCRNHLSKLWTISRSNWCAILIHTFDCNWIRTTYKLLVWSEGYSSIWSNRVSSLSWNSLLFASIVEAWLYCFIDWNQWIATLEGWSTGLWNTLRTCARCAGSCRSHLSKLWAVSRRNWCAILIYTLNSYWIWTTYKLLVWSEGYSSIWSNRVSSLSWNSLLFASIVEAWLYCFINWNQWIATRKRWSSGLWNTLRTCTCCISTCRNHFFHYRLVLDSYWSAIGIHTS
ncbi:hypothetical protein D8820_11120 [Streptococcus sanguinis]|nr:hypothetical protein D8820_11120 [Streptococcus sanguinis]